MTYNVSYTVVINAINANQLALLCNVCQQWPHCGCCDVSTTEYQCLQKILRSFCECVLPFANCSVRSVESSLNASLLALSVTLTLSKLFVPSYM